MAGQPESSRPAARAGPRESTGVRMVQMVTTPPSEATATTIMPSPQPGMMHLLDYWGVIRSRLWVAVLTVIVFVTGAAVYAFNQTPMYLSQARVLVQPAEVNVTQIKGVYDAADVGTDMASRRDFLNTQMKLVKTRANILDTFEAFKFGSKEEYAASSSPLGGFSQKVRVQLVRNTFLIDIGFEWHEPELAADVANYVANLYVAQYRERQSGISDLGLAKLKEQLKEFERQREEALKVMRTFKEGHKAYNFEDARALRVTRVNKLNVALIEAQVDGLRQQADLQAIEIARARGSSLDTLPNVLGHRSITSFKLEQLRAEAELLQLKRRFPDENPTVQTQQQIVELLGRALDVEVANVVASTKLALKEAQFRTKLLEDSIASQEQQMYQLDGLREKFLRLEDNYQSAKEAYRMVNQRIYEVEITRQTGDVEAGGKVMVIDPAVKPNAPFAPRRSLIVMSAGMVGLIIGAALCLFMEYCDRRIKTKEEVESIVGAPVLGYVPQLRGESHETQAVESSSCTVAEAFRGIRTSLALSQVGRKRRAFLVASANAGEGKTMSAFNLALAMAREDKNVILLEGDLRRPRMRRLLGDLAPPRTLGGLVQVLHGEARLREVVWPLPAQPNLHLAFCGEVPPNPSELLGSERFRGLIKEALSTYDLVLIDSPMIMGIADASILAAMGLPVVFLVRAYSTQRHQLAIAVEHIRAVQGQIAGVVVNNADVPASGPYGYYYGASLYGYGYNYSYRYKPVEYKLDDEDR